MRSGSAAWPLARTGAKQRRRGSGATRRPVARPESQPLAPPRTASPAPPSPAARARASGGPCRGLDPTPRPAPAGVGTVDSVPTPCSKRDQHGVEDAISTKQDACLY
jgi:hypothetical protein